MDGKLRLGRKEIPARHIYDYADSNRFLPLLKIYDLGYSLALNSQRYSDRSTYVDVPAGKLKGFAYSEGKVKELWLSFTGFLPVVFTISNFCKA